MDKKTKKMAVTELEIDAKKRQRSNVNERIYQLRGAKLETEAGKKAQTDVVSQLSVECDTLSAEIRQLVERLEIETVDMLSGTDTDFAEPTPADALRQVS